ncbi:rRNA maturation RNase YbeY [Leptolyngbya sp. 'hensonii']|uniref:rRNA maturation RNase YbeY n=1 Tax=Leptolyngbya sp. 'hensonii' TaxID=1922337 RepID=UPI00094F5800|nr:rRNA maturation RNase YbeY [Leptolyngbya sp. 'hensonii']OLP19581.1 rRNA maturation RNase YbeY [Leptolyngbya sp. 'hensonii']
MDVEVDVQICVAGSGADGCPESGAWQAYFQQWLELLLPTEAPNQVYLDWEQDYELTLRLTDDTEIQALNAQYRQVDRPTDVLAFAVLEGETAQILSQIDSLPVYLGDIVISIETASHQAASKGHSLSQEVTWLAAHGLLHLLGWDHPDEASLLSMLDQQEALLAAVGFAGTTA